MSEVCHFGNYLNYGITMHAHTAGPHTSPHSIMKNVEFTVKEYSGYGLSPLAQGPLHAHTRAHLASSAPLSVQDGAGSSPAVLCEAVEGGGERGERARSHLPLLRGPRWRSRSCSQTNQIRDWIRSLFDHVQKKGWGSRRAKQGCWPSFRPSVACTR